MSRVVAYVDGFNLYFCLRSKGWKKSRTPLALSCCQIQSIFTPPGTVGISITLHNEKGQVFWRDIHLSRQLNGAYFANLRQYG